MIKLIPLINATLKSFVRNKTSILLLIVAPLVLISAIFLSFNLDGLRKIPVGVIDEAPSLNLMDYKNTYLSYLDLELFQQTNHCLEQLRAYRKYVCIHLVEKDKVILNIYYDNTKEPVIWEILERIKATVETLQKEQAKQTMITLIDEFADTNNKIKIYQQELGKIQNELKEYVSEINTAQNQLQESRTYLSSSLNQMDRDIIEIKTTKNKLLTTKNQLVHDTHITINQIQHILTNLTGPEYANTVVSGLRNQINSYNTEANNIDRDINIKINNYERTSADGKKYVNEINQGIIKLVTTRANLQNHDLKVRQTNKELDSINQDLNKLISADLDLVLTPVVMQTQPAYIPEIKRTPTQDTQEEQIQQAIKGLNMISLQTIFPTVLFLILLFLSLLISSFVCLNEINSPAHIRRKTIKKIFFSELFSTFISSLIIIVIPIILILAAGHYLFNLNILTQIFPVITIMTLTISVYIFIGMTLAYLIRKESITLLLTTFILVLFIFLSGVILPLERMSTVSNTLAQNFPTYLSVSAFNKIVFHGQYINLDYLIKIGTWIILLMIITMIIKKIKEK